MPVRLWMQMSGLYRATDIAGVIRVVIYQIHVLFLFIARANEAVPRIYMSFHFGGEIRVMRMHGNYVFLFF